MSLVEKFSMHDCKPNWAPAEVSLKTDKPKDYGGLASVVFLCRQVISLLYVAEQNRLDKV